MPGDAVNYGRYQITKEVGHGSMGVVYEAHDPQINRIVALKVLRQDRMGTEAFVTRFLKEAKVVGRLSHPNIVTIYDVGEEQDSIYIAMEFLAGSTLASFIQADTQRACKEVAAIGVQIAEALDYAHQKGVVHRDIKPSNIVMQENGLIKITDFGIAHIDDSSVTMQTQAGEILGTPTYMSPEQVQGKPVDGRSDLFSLGAILYELCTGRRAFGGSDKNLAIVFNEIITVTPEEPCAIAPQTPRNFSEIIMKAIEKEPINRFQTGKELADALRNALSETTLTAAALPAAEKKKIFSYPLLAAMVVVLAAGASVHYLQSSKPSFQNAPEKKDNLPPLSAPLAPVGPSQKASSEPRIPAQQTGEQSQPLPSPGAPLEHPRPKQTLETDPQKQRPLPEKSPPGTILFTLKVRTTPLGANVSVDGVSKGSTPLTLQLPKGTHLLRMTQPGYRDMAKQITIEEDMEYPLTFTLKKVAKPD